jgi:hypothetical protein
MMSTQDLRICATGIQLSPPPREKEEELLGQVFPHSASSIFRFHQASHPNSGWCVALFDKSIE